MSAREAILRSTTNPGAREASNMSAALWIRVQWNELGEKAIVDIVTAEQTSRKLSASV